MVENSFQITDYANGEPVLPSAPAEGRVALPWLDLFDDRERAAMRAFAVIIFPDRQVTRRLTRHLVATPLGASLYAAKTLEEAWAYIEAHELAPVGVWCGGGPLSLSPPPSSPLPPDPSQLGLFDGAEGT